MGLYYDIFETPAGWMGALRSSTGLRRVTTPQKSPDMCMLLLGEEVEGVTPSTGRFAALKNKLRLYFLGIPTNFDDEPTDINNASIFLSAAWNACRTIPWGETRSYQWIAAQAGRPRAPRAAGQAMARNRLAVIIPCHRVIASDGSLGGYGNGASQLNVKRWLLGIEANGEEGSSSLLPRRPKPNASTSYASLT